MTLSLYWTYSFLIYKSIKSLFPFQDEIFGTIPATWGLGVEATDWNLAAEEAARRVHAANPDLLVIVGGIISNVVLLPAYFAPIKIENQVNIFGLVLVLNIIMTFLYFIFFNCLFFMWQGVRTSTITLPKVLSTSFDKLILLTKWFSTNWSILLTKWSTGSLNIIIFVIWLKILKVQILTVILVTVLVVNVGIYFIKSLTNSKSHTINVYLPNDVGLLHFWQYTKLLKVFQENNVNLENNSIFLYFYKKILILNLGTHFTIYDGQFYPFKGR